MHHPAHTLRLSISQQGCPQEGWIVHEVSDVLFAPINAPIQAIEVCVAPIIPWLSNHYC
jgi:hypothetical protein